MKNEIGYHRIGIFGTTLIYIDIYYLYYINIINMYYKLFI